MTDLQDNPYIEEDHGHARPVRYVCQVRDNMGSAFRTLMEEVPTDQLGHYRAQVDALNSNAGYRKYRIVSR